MPLPAHVTTLKQYFETLSADSVALLPGLYAPQARFKDPFNDVQGVAAIERIFRHMFEQVEAPRFLVHDVVADAGQAFMRWDFRFGCDGRVTEHRDYWDAAEELYEKLPFVGALMRWLRRRSAA